MNNPDEDWLTTEQAARVLSISPGTFYKSNMTDSIKLIVRHRMVGTNPRHGWLWNRDDLERIVRIRRQYELRTTTAVRAISNGLRS